MKIRIFLLKTMVLLIGLALPHLPKGKDSKSQFVALNKGHSLSIPPGRLHAGPKYRPITPPTNLMVNPLIRPKRDGAHCMYLKTHLDGKITDVA
jgi:hypothetical protein